MFISLIPILADARYRLSIYVEMRDCVNCFASFSTLDHLDEQVELFIMFDRQDSIAAMDLMSKYSNVEYLRGHSYFVDSKHITAYARGQATCVLFENGKVLWSFPLRELMYRWEEVNALSHDHDFVYRTISVDSLRISPNVKVRVGNNRMVIMDALLSKQYIADWSMDSLSIHQLKLSAREMHGIFELFEKDQAQYDSLVQYLDAYGMRDPRVIYAQFILDGLLILWTVTYPDLSNDNELVLQPYPCFYFYSEREAVTVSPLRWKVKPDSLSYMVIAETGFHLSKEGLYMPVIRRIKEHGQYLMGIFSLEDSGFKFDRFTPVTVSSRIFDNYPGEYPILCAIDDGISYMPGYPYMYRIEDGKELDYSPLIASKRNAKWTDGRIFFYQVLDIRSFGMDLVEVVYAYNGKVMAVWVDLRNGKAIKRRTIVGLSVDALVQLNANGELVELSVKNKAILIRR